MKTALISVNHLKITGVTTHVIELCKFLLINDIDVTVHVSQPVLEQKEFKTVCNLLLGLQVTVCNDTRVINRNYDYVYLNTGTISFDVKDLKASRIIYFVHGEGTNYTHILKSTELQQLEVIVFSETMKEYIREQTFYAPKLIRHVVDTETRIYGGNSIHLDLKTVLVVDAHFYTPIASKVLEVCNKHGFALRVCGGDSLSLNKLNVRDQILKSDLVIGQGGRTIYEAMSLGRTTISYGLNPGCGYIDTSNIKEHVKTNCSYGKLLSCTDSNSTKELETEILKYSYSDGVKNCQYAIENFNQSNFKSLI